MTESLLQKIVDMKIEKYCLDTEPFSASDIVLALRKDGIKDKYSAISRCVRNSKVIDFYDYVKELKFCPDVQQELYVYYAPDVESIDDYKFPKLNNVNGIKVAVIDTGEKYNVDVVAINKTKEAVLTAVIEKINASKYIKDLNKVAVTVNNNEYDSYDDFLTEYSPVLKVSIKTSDEKPAYDYVLHNTILQNMVGVTGVSPTLDSGLHLCGREKNRHVDIEKIGEQQFETDGRVRLAKIFVKQLDKNALVLTKENGRVVVSTLDSSLLNIKN